MHKLICGKVYIIYFALAFFYRNDDGFTDPFNRKNTEILENGKSMDFKWNVQYRKIKKTIFKLEIRCLNRESDLKTYFSIFLDCPFHLKFIHFQFSWISGFFPLKGSVNISSLVFYLQAAHLPPRSIGIHGNL